MFKKKNLAQTPGEMSLNISSLMDIMTILLLFLLMSFESKEQEVDPPKDISLPVSSAEVPVKLALKVSVSQDEVRVEEDVVVKLNRGKLRRSDLDSSKNVKPLLKELRRQKARLQSGTRVAKAGEEDDSEIVYFEAAKGTRYAIVDRVMKTAAAAGFTKFRLAVNRKF